VQAYNLRRPAISGSGCRDADLLGAAASPS